MPCRSEYEYSTKRVYEFRTVEYTCFLFCFVFVSGQTSGAGFIQCGCARICSDKEASPFPRKEVKAVPKGWSGKDSSTSCRKRTLPYSRHLRRDFVSWSPCLPVCLTAPRFFFFFGFPPVPSQPLVTVVSSSHLPPLLLIASSLSDLSIVLSTPSCLRRLGAA